MFYRIYTVLFMAIGSREVRYDPRVHRMSYGENDRAVNIGDVGYGTVE